MTNIQKESLNAIINHYGKASQEDMAIEECSELIKAILKIRRGSGTLADLVDEIADVEIMMAQLEIINGIEGYVQNQIEFKIERQLKRIRKEQQNGGC